MLHAGALVFVDSGFLIWRLSVSVLLNESPGMRRPLRPVGVMFAGEW